MKIFRAGRLVSKGAVFVDFVEVGAGNSAGAARPATAVTKPGVKKAVVKPGGVRPATAMVGSKKSASVSAAATEETTVTTNENLADIDDPIALALQSRLKAGGVSSVVKEADAKKNGMPMHKFAKHSTKAAALLTLVQEESKAGAPKAGSSLKTAPF